MDHCWPSEARYLSNKISRTISNGAPWGIRIIWQTKIWRYAIYLCNRTDHFWRIEARYPSKLAKNSERAKWFTRVIWGTVFNRVKQGIWKVNPSRLTMTFVPCEEHQLANFDLTLIWVEYLSARLSQVSQHEPATFRCQFQWIFHSCGIFNDKENLTDVN